MQVSPFAKELYKKVRSQCKKLDDIAKIEEKVANKVKIPEEQSLKLKMKDSLTSSVKETLENFEIYKKTEYELLFKLQQELSAPKEEPKVEEKHEEVPETK